MAYAELFNPNTADLQCNTITVNSQGGGQPIYIGALQDDTILSNNTVTNLQFANGTIKGDFGISGFNIRVPIEGYYLFMVSGSWVDAGTVNATPFDRIIRLTYGGQIFCEVNSKIVGSATNTNSQTPVYMSCVKSVGPGQDINWRAFQNSGANLTLKGGLNSSLVYDTTLTIMYLCPL